MRARLHRHLLHHNELTHLATNGRSAELTATLPATSMTRIPQAGITGNCELPPRQPAISKQPPQARSQKKPGPGRQERQPGSGPETTTTYSGTLR